MKVDYFDVVLTFACIFVSDTKLCGVFSVFEAMKNKSSMLASLKANSDRPKPSTSASSSSSATQK